MQLHFINQFKLFFLRHSVLLFIINTDHNDPARPAPVNHEASVAALCDGGRNVEKRCNTKTESRSAELPPVCSREPVRLETSP